MDAYSWPARRLWLVAGRAQARPQAHAVAAARREISGARRRQLADTVVIGRQQVSAVAVAVGMRRLLDAAVTYTGRPIVAAVGPNRRAGGGRRTASTVTNSCC